MKQESPNTGGEADIDRLRTLSGMLLLPPNITCNLTPEEEKALARQIAEQGDESATIRLYCCCIAVVFYYFFRRTRGDRSETENLTQETLIRAVDGLRNGVWTGEAFRPWLFGIARNVFLEWWRTNKKWSATADRNGSYPADETEQFEQVDLLDEVLMRERGKTLWELVGELPEMERLVLFLRFFHGLHYAEMATLMKCTEQACKTRCWRALKHLRENVQQTGIREELGYGKDKQQHS